MSQDEAQSKYQGYYCCEGMERAIRNRPPRSGGFALKSYRNVGNNSLTHRYIFEVRYNTRRDWRFGSMCGEFINFCPFCGKKHNQDLQYKISRKTQDLKRR